MIAISLLAAWMRLPLQLPPEEVHNGRKMTVIADSGGDEAKDGLFGG